MGLFQEEPLGIAGVRFLEARCPSCHRTNSVETVKEKHAGSDTKNTKKHLGSQHLTGVNMLLK